jgi:hypothetical protein
MQAASAIVACDETSPSVIRGEVSPSNPPDCTDGTFAFANSGMITQRGVVRGHELALDGGEFNSFIFKHIVTTRTLAREMQCRPYTSN